MKFQRKPNPYLEMVNNDIEHVKWEIDDTGCVFTSKKASWQLKSV